MSKFNDKAVALKYRRDKDKAPVIVAAGSGCKAALEAERYLQEI